MTIRGLLSDLQKSGDPANFVITQDNGQTFPAQAPADLLHGFKNGDRVDAEGELPPDPPFLVRSLQLTKTPRTFPWKWVMGAVAACVLVAVVWGLIRPKRVLAPTPPVVDATPAESVAVPAAPPAEQPRSAPPPSGRLHLKNIRSLKCLTPAGGVRDNNVAMVQYACDMDPSRFWRFQTVKDGIVLLINENSALCLGTKDGSTASNATTVQQTCDNDPARQWRYISMDASTFRLVNVRSGLCLTPMGDAEENNATVVQYTCDSDPARNWQAPPF